MDYLLVSFMFPLPVTVLGIDLYRAIATMH
jgi:hypothetical protein